MEQLSVSADSPGIFSHKVLLRTLLPLFKKLSASAEKPGT
jgi:hypothetical protein